MLTELFTFFCLATSRSASFTVGTTTTQHSANGRNEATSHQYQVLVSLITLFITYF
jgi:hypothetical protein